MKARGIIYSAPMIHALLEGQKTETRRMKGLDKINKDPDRWELHTEEDNKFLMRSPKHSIVVTCPYGKPDDFLYARENWAVRDCDTLFHKVKVEYQATPGRKYYFIPKKSVTILPKPLGGRATWKPSIHLPMELTRIWKVIREVKLERLQDIGEDAAVREGIETNDYGYRGYGSGFKKPMSAYWSFKSLWDSIHGSESWPLNPWVWAIKFEVISNCGCPDELKQILK